MAGGWAQKRSGGEEGSRASFLRGVGLMGQAHLTVVDTKGFAEGGIGEMDPRPRVVLGSGGLCSLHWVSD